MFMDTQLEKDIKLGSKYKYPSMTEGQCMINTYMANQMKVNETDLVYVQFDAYQNLIAVINEYNKDAITRGLKQIDEDVVEAGNDNQRVKIPCRVSHIGNETYGKFPRTEVEDMILMEYEYLYLSLAKYMPPGKLAENKDFLNFMKNNYKQLAYDHSDFVMMTLPEPRVAAYSDVDYAVIQRTVTGYANDLIEDLGFFPVKMRLDVLKSMEGFSQAILFLGLIFDIIILLFVQLSVLLIYSLLMISVESKTFEFGIMRMVGLSKSGIVYMVLI